MSDNNYNVQIVAQHYDDATLTRLAALFKKSEAQISAALAKGNIVAKRDIDQSAALQYKKAIEQKTGVLCIIAAPDLPLQDYPDVIKPAATKAHPQRTAPAATSRKKTYLIAGATALALILSALVSYHLWTTSPAYSLMQISRAINEKNLSLSRRHVDYETMISRGLEVASAREFKPAATSNNPWETLGSQIGEGIANLMLPAVSRKLSSELEQAIEQGELPKKRGAARLDTIAAALGEIKQEGKLAYVHAPLQHPAFENKTFTLVFSLREMDGYWQMFELNNLADYLDWQSEQKAYYLTQANAPILEALESSLGEIRFEHERLQANPFLGRELRLVMHFENISDKVIKTLYSDIRISRADNGEIITEQSLSWGDGSTELNPGDSAYITKDISSFADPALKSYLANPDTDLSIDYQVSSISFADGSELALYRTFSHLP